jgi:hypothetical protein
MTNKANSINRLSQESIPWAGAAILLRSAASRGAVSSGPRPQPPTAESFVWDFPAEVTSTLREIEREANEVRRNASTLQMPADFPKSCSTQIRELQAATEPRHRISDRMSGLQEIRRVAEPWQRQSLDRFAAELDAAAGSAERVIAAFGPQGRKELHSAACRQSLDALSRATQAMRRASRVEWAQDYPAFYLNPKNVTPLPVSPTPGD